MVNWNPKAADDVRAKQAEFQRQVNESRRPGSGTAKPTSQRVTIKPQKEKR
jgi:hypothetical protein